MTDSSFRLTSAILCCLLLLSSCTRGEEDQATDTTEPSDTSQLGGRGELRAAEFCVELTEVAWATGDDAAEFVLEFTELLNRAPAAIEAPAAALSSSSGSSESAVAVRLTALKELDAWYEQNCIDSEPVRHVAPPAPRLGWLVCDNVWATTAFQGPVGPVYPGTTVIYGDSSLAEPFAGPTVSVLSGVKLWPQEETGISVQVNGAEAVAGPAQLFQFITNPDLGHVVTWAARGDRPRAVWARVFRRTDARVTCPGRDSLRR